MQHSPKIVLFTDLDGTLLDQFDFTWDAARPVLERLYIEKIPIIFCTSKTRQETIYYRGMIGVEDPFIVESGAATFVPFGYFDYQVSDKLREGYEFLEKANDRSAIRRFVQSCQHEWPEQFLGLNNMDTEKIQQISRIPRHVAEMSIQREYNEFFYFQLDADEPFPQKLLTMAGKENLQLNGEGKFHHIMGNYDRGQAVRELLDLYRRFQAIDCISIGIGDSISDLAMLKSVDIPYLVKNYRDSYDEMILNQIDAKLADGVGPEGWAKAVQEILDEYGLGA